MVATLLERCAILFLITACIAVTLQNNEDYTSFNGNQVHSYQKEHKNEDRENSVAYREKRFIKKRKPGFFSIVGRLLYEQINETTSAYRQISKLVNQNFADSNEAIQSSTMSTDPNATTTEAPFRITREELFAILRRNVRGLIRLFRLELNDALNQSSYTFQDYRKEASNQLAKALG